MLQRGSIKDLAQSEAQLFLIEVAQQELCEAGFICSPIRVTYCALHGCIEGLNIDAWFAFGCLLEREGRLKVGDAGEGQGARIRHVCVIWLDCRHLGDQGESWVRAMAGCAVVDVAVEDV